MPARVVRGAVAGLAMAGALGAAVAWTQEREPMQPGRGPGLSPVFAALDTDHDNVISARELAASAAALQTLDRSGDGRLDADEVRPAFGRGGRGREGGGRGGGRRGDEPGETAPTSPDELTATLMTFDANADGRLTRTEVPERMQGLFDRVDANKDGTLTAEELKTSAARQAGPADGMRGRDDEPGRGEGRRGRGPGGMGMRADPLITALDTDRDGAISAEEMRSAPVTLRTLDSNGDGSLSVEETRPAPGPGRGQPQP